MEDERRVTDLEPISLDSSPQVYHSSSSIPGTWICNISNGRRKQVVLGSIVLIPVWLDCAMTVESGPFRGLYGPSLFVTFFPLPGMDG